ncbi:MAG: hypothetical protein J5708_07925 [Bacteroidales bacterium]|nr:hypothetical protein [Bacteroidales bacterium]
MKQLRIILFAVALVFAFGWQNVNAQSKNRSKADDPIKTSGDYFWGESSNTGNQKEARQQALDNLIDNIKNNYKSQAYLQPNIAEEHYNLIYESFKTELDEISTTKCTGSDNTELMRYIKKSEFDSLCEDRQKQIFSAIQRGLDNEERESTGDALRAYYKALMLCYSHPRSKAIKYTTEDNIEHPVINWLVEDKIDGDNGILKNINVVVKSWIRYKDHSDANIAIFNNHKLNNIRFNYFDPVNQKIINYNIENGEATLKLAKKANESYIKIDFSYPEFKTSDPVAYFMNENLIDEVFFHNSTYSIKKPKNKEIVIIDDIPNDNDIMQYLTDSKFQVNLTTMSECEAVMKKVQNAINNQDIEAIAQYFTEESFHYFKQMLGYNDKPEDRPIYKIIDNNCNYCYIAYDDEIICRSIPMQFEYRNNLIFTKSLSFRLNKSDKTINSVVVRLPESVENDIFSQSPYKQWDATVRINLMNFLEDFQTAYMTKNIDCLNNFFDNDPLIIIEHTIRKNSENNKNISETLSKEQYFKNVERSFKHNNAINIRFSDINIEDSKRARGLFGINMLQEYTNQSYTDNGYVFLYVDLRSKPIIYVRAWQPEKTAYEDIFTIRDIH